MNFKFACPACRQHIQTESESTGLHIDCPACQAKIVVPASPEVQGLVPIAAWANPPEQPAPIKREPELQRPPPPPKPAAPPPQQMSEQDPDNPFAIPLKTKVTEVSHTESRIAVLTSTVKLEIVRAARQLIADKSRWLPGKPGSVDYAYAAKSSGGNIVPVPFASVEATHFSIFGAVLLELHRRNVANTARGRREFLDLELAEAIRGVLSREGDGAATDEKDRPPLTHDQCLGVLDVLEERYSADMSKNKAQKADTKLECVGIEDLMRKLEQKSPITPEDVAIALDHELEEIKKRLTALEQDSTKVN